MHESFDPLQGPRANHYADIAPCAELQSDLTRVFTGAKEVAIIAFWDLEKETDTFECVRHFLVPNPKMRMVKDIGGT